MQKQKIVKFEIIKIKFRIFRNFKVKYFFLKDDVFIRSEKVDSFISWNLHLFSQVNTRELIF
jgi:hypothetical protein